MELNRYTILLVITLVFFFSFLFVGLSFESTFLPFSFDVNINLKTMTNNTTVAGKPYKSTVPMSIVQSVFKKKLNKMIKIILNYVYRDLAGDVSEVHD